MRMRTDLVQKRITESSDQSKLSVINWSSPDAESEHMGLALLFVHSTRGVSVEHCALVLLFVRFVLHMFVSSVVYCERPERLSKKLINCLVSILWSWYGLYGINRGCDWSDSQFIFYLEGGKYTVSHKRLFHIHDYYITNDYANMQGPKGIIMLSWHSFGTKYMHMQHSCYSMWRGQNVGHPNPSKGPICAKASGVPK